MEGELRAIGAKGQNAIRGYLRKNLPGTRVPHHRLTSGCHCNPRPVRTEDCVYSGLTAIKTSCDGPSGCHFNESDAAVGRYRQGAVVAHAEDLFGTKDRRRRIAGPLPALNRGLRVPACPWTGESEDRKRVVSGPRGA